MRTTKYKVVGFQSSMSGSYAECKNVPPRSKQEYEVLIKDRGYSNGDIVEDTSDHNYDTVEIKVNGVVRFSRKDFEREARERSESIARMCEHLKDGNLSKAKEEAGQRNKS